jgi:hypothetical protein
VATSIDRAPRGNHRRQPELNGWVAKRHGCRPGYHFIHETRPEEHGPQWLGAKPFDTSKLQRVGNGLAAGLDRSLDWIHLPVPRARDDVEYFARLAHLELRTETELYLRLVHVTDGIAGAIRRIQAASEIVPASFGIATECGFGRRPSESIPELLQLHWDIATQTVTAG